MKSNLGKIRRVHVDIYCEWFVINISITKYHYHHYQCVVGVTSYVGFYMVQLLWPTLILFFWKEMRDSLQEQKPSLWPTLCTTLCLQPRISKRIILTQGYVLIPYFVIAISILSKMHSSVKSILFWFLENVIDFSI